MQFKNVAEILEAIKSSNTRSEYSVGKSLQRIAIKCIESFPFSFSQFYPTTASFISIMCAHILVIRRLAVILQCSKYLLHLRNSGET